MVETREDLVAAVRRSLGKRVRFSEVRMFGGIGFLLDGKIFVGTSKRGLLVRVGKEGYRAALKKPGVRPMVMGDRVSEGFVFVNPQVLTAAELRKWIDIAIDFVKTLPAKSIKNRAKHSREKTP